MKRRTAPIYGSHPNRHSTPPIAIPRARNIPNATPNSTFSTVFSSRSSVVVMLSSLLAVVLLFMTPALVLAASDVVITDNIAKPVRPVPSGGAFYSVQRANITTASVNLAFGFRSKKVMVRAALTNTDDLCLDWLGGTAACPAANTAGNTRLLPGLAIVLDDFAVTSLSVIAASGTQQVNITAWGP